jgi:hypothetical protein
MGKYLRTGVLLGAACVALSFAGVGTAQTSPEGGASPLAAQADQPLPRNFTPDEMERLGDSSVVAGEEPGETIYSNTINPITSVYVPGPGQRMADDLHLAASGCTLTHYELGVYGSCALQSCPTFNVDVALWDGDPCDPNSSVIAGTEQSFTGIPRDNIPKIASLTLDTPVAIPDDVWMAATFSSANTGWLVAGPAEIGSTQNLFSENDSQQGCDLYVLQSGTHAGFWASINCDLAQPPLGACCNLAQCTQTTEANCTGGVWQGAFTTCVPNSCLTGTCCSGLEFDDCQSTSEAGCTNGIFSAGDTCDVEGCSPTFKVYENDFFTGVFSGVVPEDSKYGDDLQFAPGAPCDLIAYDVTVFGDPTAGPAAFSATLELWTNDDNGTPETPEDDLPLAPIPGTARTFSNIPADFFGHRLLAGAFDGIVLPERAWVVIETSSENAGPGLGGEADIGTSLDLFAIFNSDDAPNEWLGGFFFGGFDPDDPCPGGTQAPCPAGSFRTNVWCKGNAPTGACCDRFSGTCADNVTLLDCNGRWAEGASCSDEGVFDPPCGTHACCHKFELNPQITLCQNLTEAECAGELAGFLSRGKFCSDLNDTCPEAVCMGRAGECLEAHGTAGCEDPFCTCTVCDTQGDDFCCTIEWDSFCVQTAEEECNDLQNNDACPNAIAISGAGTFAFDNTDATRDGPSHEACPSPSGNDIIRDLWFRWTSPCTDQVVISTCDLTSVDTKVAIYETVDCPVQDADLLACNDDRCTLQSLTTFNAVNGQEYLIRVGSAPNQGGGEGSFTITCGPPDNASCPGGTSDCCTATTGTAACTNESCCELVCACDPFCCDTEWDAACSTTGFEGIGCGAEMICAPLCGGCPDGAFHFVPPDGVVDARQPFSPITGTPLLGIDEIVAIGPPGADPSCFSFCETEAHGAPNGIVDINEVAGVYTIELVRPITPGAVTTLTYTNAAGADTTGEFISHPANANGDDMANGADVEDLAGALGGPGSLPFGNFSRDIDHSNAFTPLDLLAGINLLNGSAMFEVWNNTPLPTSNTCP